MESLLFPNDLHNKNLILWGISDRIISQQLKFKSEVEQRLGNLSKTTTRTISTFLSLYRFKDKVVVMLRFKTWGGKKK